MKELHEIAETHVRLHDRDGYVMSIDLDFTVSDVISHIMKLRDGDT